MNLDDIIKASFEHEAANIIQCQDKEAETLDYILNYVDNKQSNIFIKVLQIFGKTVSYIPIRDVIGIVIFIFIMFALPSIITQIRQSYNPNFTRNFTVDKSTKEPSDSESNKLNVNNDENINESIQPTNQALNQLETTVTFNDQKQVEEVIRGYFSAIEKKQYSKAWELTSSEQKKVYTKKDALKNHWGYESVKLVSMRGYLPSKGIAEAVPPNVPTVWFIVTLDTKPTSDNAWNKGIFDRFVNVAKDADGKWRIDGIASGP